MRRIAILGGILGLLAGFAHAACDPGAAPTYTARAVIPKPAINSCGWGAVIDSNYDILDASMVLTGVTNNFTADNSFNNITIKYGNKLNFQTSLGSNQQFISNLNATNLKTLEIFAPDGLGINRSPTSSGTPSVEISGLSNNSPGSFGLMSSSANLTATYSGFIATSPVAQSVLWVLPTRDGTAGQVFQTDGAGNLSFVTPTSGAGGSGSISVSNQNNVPRYSVAGSSNVVAGAGNLTNDGATVNVVQSNAGNVNALVITSTGTGNALFINNLGEAGGGVQLDNGGALNVKQTVLGDAVVIVSSYTDAQVGSSDLLILDRNVNRNDPIIRVFKAANNSAPEMRWDSPAPNMEMVATSTDNAHGRGKWEPYAIPFQSEILQVNSRSWDNTTFETEAYWEPRDIQSSVATPGLFLEAQSLSNDSGVLTSTNTSGINFFTQNNHTVGLTGPLNVAVGSWRFRLPHTLNNQGQILYQADNGDTFNDRTWEFTVGGSSTMVLTNGGTGAPYWSSNLSGSTILTSSGVAFGSGTNTVTSDSTTFSYSKTFQTLNVTNNQTDPGFGTYHPNIELTKVSGNSNCQFWDDNSGTDNGFGVCQDLQEFDFDALTNVHGNTGLQTFMKFNTTGSFPTGSTVTFNVPVIATSIRPTSIVWPDGTIQVSSPPASGAGGSGSTIYAATATASFPFGFTASTITISSNTVLPGATFYAGAGVGSVINISSINAYNVGGIRFVDGVQFPNINSAVADLNGKGGTIYSEYTEEFTTQPIVFPNLTNSGTKVELQPIIYKTDIPFFVPANSTVEGADGTSGNFTRIQASTNFPSGFYPPLAPTVGTASCTGCVLNGNYIVAVTYENDLGPYGDGNDEIYGETTLSPEVPISVTAGSSITVTIPSAPSSNVFGCNIYITPAGGNSGSETLQNSQVTPFACGTVVNIGSIKNFGLPPDVNTTAPVMVMMGANNNSAGMGAMIKNLTVDCNAVPNSVGILMLRAQENAGLDQVVVGNCQEGGVVSYRANAQNSTIMRSMYDNFSTQFGKGIKPSSYTIVSVQRTSGIDTIYLSSQTPRFLPGAQVSISGTDAVDGGSFNVQVSTVCGPPTVGCITPTDSSFTIVQAGSNISKTNVVAIASTTHFMGGFVFDGDTNPGKSAEESKILMGVTSNPYPENGQPLNGYRPAACIRVMQTRYLSIIGAHMEYCHDGILVQNTSGVELNTISAASNNSGIVDNIVHLDASTLRANIIGLSQNSQNPSIALEDDVSSTTYVAGPINFYSLQTTNGPTSLITFSTSTANPWLIPAGIASTQINISSNTILSGATFYQNGSIVLGKPGSQTNFLSDINVTSGTWLNGSAGTLGQVFTSNGVNNIPSWTTLSSAGTLGVTTGAVSGYTGPPISSPTLAIVFDSATFQGQLRGSATAFIQLNPSSATLQGLITASSLGAVTNVTGTAPIISGGGATPAISLSQTIGQQETFTSSVTYTNTVLITTNTILPGATFYNQGSIVLGNPSNSVKISSNTLLSGASFFNNAIPQIQSPGSNTNLLFNNGGPWGASSSLSWNGTNVLVTGGIVASSTETFNGGLTVNSSTTLRDTLAAGGKAASTYSLVIGTSVSVGSGISQTPGPFALAISTFNHINFEDQVSSPTVTSCGTSTNLIGTDTAFQVTSGAGATGCTITFANAFIKTPICVVTEETQSVVNALSYTVSPTAVTLSQTAMGVDKFDVHCFGRD